MKIKLEAKRNTTNKGEKMEKYLNVKGNVKRGKKESKESYKYQ